MNNNTILQLAIFVAHLSHYTYSSWLVAGHISSLIHASLSLHRMTI